MYSTVIAAPAIAGGASYMFIWSPHSNTPAVKVFVLDPAPGGIYHYLTDIVPSEDISANYVMGDLCSGILEIVSATTSGTVFNIQGTINAVYVQRLPALASLNYATLLSFAYDNKNVVAGIPISRGVSMLAAPDDENTLEYFQNTGVISPKNVQLVTGGPYPIPAYTNEGTQIVVYNSGPLIPGFTVSPPEGSVAPVIPPNMGGTYAIDFSVTIGYVSRVGGDPQVVNMNVMVVEDGADPNTFASVPVVVTQTYTNANAFPAGGSNFTISGKFFRTSNAPLNQFALTADTATPTGGSQFRIIDSHIQLQMFTPLSRGQVQPTHITICRALSGGQTISINGISNYAVVPNAALQQQVKPVDMSASEMDTLATMNLAIAGELTWLMPSDVYQRGIASPSFMPSVSREQTYQAASKFGSLMSYLTNKAKPLIKQYAPSIGRAAGGALGLYAGNPMLGQAIGSRLGSAFGDKYFSASSQTDYTCSSKPSTSTQGAPLVIEEGPVPKAIVGADLIGHDNISFGKFPTDYTCSSINDAPAVELHLRHNGSDEADAAANNQETHSINGNSSLAAAFSQARTPASTSTMTSATGVIDAISNKLLNVTTLNQEKARFLQGERQPLAAAFDKAGVAWGVCQFPAINKAGEGTLFTLLVTNRPVRFGDRHVVYEAYGNDNLAVYADVLLTDFSEIGVVILAGTRAAMFQPLYISTNLDGTSGGLSFEAAMLVAASLIPVANPVTGVISGGTVTELTSKVIACAPISRALIVHRPDNDSYNDLIAETVGTNIEIPYWYEYVTKNNMSADKIRGAFVTYNQSEFVSCVLALSQSGIIGRQESSTVVTAEISDARDASKAALKLQKTKNEGAYETDLVIPQRGLPSEIIPWDSFSTEEALENLLSPHHELMAELRIPREKILNLLAGQQWDKLNRVLTQLLSKAYSESIKEVRKGGVAAAASSIDYPPGVTSVSQKKKYRERMNKGYTPPTTTTAPPRGLAALARAAQARKISSMGGE